MPTPKQRRSTPAGEEPSEQKQQEQQRLRAALGKQVLLALGQPGNLVEVQVRSLWAGRYRVNVFVGLDVVSARVAHSFFLIVDEQGQIIAATPDIVRRY